MIRTNLEYASRAKRPVFIDSEAMPESYGSTSVVLIARDPRWIHAYWEIAPSSIEEVRARYGKSVDRAVKVLRMYDVTMINFDGRNANHIFDIEVGDANNWYVNLPNDHVSYCADIGLLTPESDFFTLARSNFVTTPRAHVSPRKELVWMAVEPGAEPTAFVYDGEDPALETGKTSVPSDVVIGEAHIRDYYSRVFPLLRRVLMRHASEEGATAQSAVDAALQYIEDQDMMAYDYFRRILLGASEEMMEKGRMGEEGIGGISSEELAPSSWGGASEEGAPGPQSGFFFELGTELIVYGRTEPDAKVEWGGKPIMLREDGTFTLRMALPTDTHIPLDFTAVKYDGRHRRSINTAAQRDSTEYKE
ncbi:MAG: DUF4912 domain-containing protein [Candidatus Omnitrophota bacterium]